MPSVAEVIKDPDFLELPDPEKMKVLQSIDADFAGLPGNEQQKVLSQLRGPKKLKRQQAPPAPKWATEQGPLGSFGPTAYGIAGAARETLGPLAEVGGLALGSIAGSPAGPVSSLAGAGLGYAAVRRGLSSLDVALGNKPPQTIGQEALAGGRDVLQGAELEAGAQVLGAGVQKAVNAPGDLYRAYRTRRAAQPAMAEARARQALSEETGVPLTPAATLQEKAPAMVETQLRENIGSASVAEKFDAVQKARLEDLAKATQRTLGGVEAPLEAGQLAQEAGRGRYKAFMSRAGEYYKQIPSQDIPVETPALRDVAIGHMDELGQINTGATRRLLETAKRSVTREMKYEPGTPERISELSAGSKTPTTFNVGRGNQVTVPPTARVSETPAGAGGITESTGQPFKGGDMPTYTIKQLLDDYSTLGKMAASTGDYNKKRIFNSLREAMLDDLADFANKVNVPEIKTAIDKAMSFYKKGDAQFPGGIRTFRNKRIANALKSESPEAIVRDFMKPRNVSYINRLKNATGSTGFQSLKKAWFQDLIARGPDQTFSHNRFVTAMNHYYQEPGQATLNAIASAKEREGIRKLYEMSRTISDAEKLAPNPSGTGRTLLNSAYLWINHPIRQFMTQFSARKIAQRYFEDPEFQRIMLSGLRAPATDRKAIDAARQLTAILTRSVGVNAVPALSSAGTTGGGNQALSFLGGREALPAGGR